MTAWRTRALVVCMALPAAVPGHAAAQGFALSEPEHRTIVVEHVAELEIRRYLPPVVLDTTVTRAAARYDTPESAMTAVLSASFAADHEWYLSIFNQRSQDWLAGRIARDGHDPEERAAEWRDAARGRRGRVPVLHLRAEIEPYVYLAVRIVKQEDLEAFLESGPEREDDSIDLLYVFYRDPGSQRWARALMPIDDPFKLYFYDDSAQTTYRRPAHYGIDEW